ncbi:uncharacterized protein C9orf40 homolog [Sphaerodactylus townsendi]|uniref:Uncharacterized protein n=1 Tax=Sphaerodactylus townsendi TaxID=933632 RepID=A0ACB8ER67_9SAUR|nr:uncharacterized protein C9orf40 homolog [Sphaerodactylus townsendi]
MAKYGAEALAVSVPWETFAAHPPTKRAHSELGARDPPYGENPWSGGGCKKRKRTEEETSGDQPVASKQEGLQEGRGLPAGTSVLEGTGTQRQEQPESDEEDGLGEACPWSPKSSMAQEHEDDAWRYNSFQYWRPPLPAIDLNDILNLENENMVKTRHSSHAGLSEMET